MGTDDRVKVFMMDTDNQIYLKKKYTTWSSKTTARLSRDYYRDNLNNKNEEYFCHCL